MSDLITILGHTTSVLTKNWQADGVIRGYDNAKHFRTREIEVAGIRQLSRLLTKLERFPDRCIIRGTFLGEETARRLDPQYKPGLVRRLRALFDDKPLHAMLIEVDNFRPKTADPIEDPETCIREYILASLPECFYEIHCHWQLSSSAGHATKAGLLKVHLWFWLRTPYSSADLKRWAKSNKIECDTSLFNPVQIHYTAAPLFAKGVVDPIPTRSGLLEGLIGDEVDLIIDPVAIAGPAVTSVTSIMPAAGDQVTKLLYDAGLVKGLRSDGGLNIICPCHLEHTTDSSDTSTVYFSPHTGGHTRWAIVCKHDHCSERSREDFLHTLGVPKEQLSTMNLDDLSVKLACYPSTHMANVGRLKKRFGDGIIFSAGQYYVWQGTHWQADNDAIYVFASKLSSIIRDEIKEYAQLKFATGQDTESDDSYLKAMKQWARNTEMRPQIDAVVKLGMHFLAVPAQQLNKDPHLLNCANGTIDLKTGFLKNHDRNDYITHCIDIRYEPSAEAPLWQQTIRRIFGEEESDDTSVSEFVQDWFGYCATGETREQVFVVHYGMGSNGKSTILDIITKILGSYACTAPPGFLTNRNDHPTGIAELLGRRMVTAHESGEGAR